MLLPLAVPAPLMVHVPELSDWLPTAGGLPTSVQDQPDGHGEAEAGGAGAVPRAPTETESMVEEPAVPLEPEVPKSPTMSASGMTSITELPATSVYVTPSPELAALKPS